MYLKFMRLCYPRASFFVKTFSSNWTSIVPLSIKETDNYGLPVLFHNDFIPSYDSSHKLSSLYGKIDGQIIAYMFINKRISTFLKWLLSYPRDILIPLPERLCNMFRTYIHTYIQTSYNIHINIHTYKHKYIHTYKHTYIHTYIYTYIHMDIHIRTYICARARKHANTITIQTKIRAHIKYISYYINTHWYVCILCIHNTCSRFVYINIHIPFLVFHLRTLYICKFLSISRQNTFERRNTRSTTALLCLGKVGKVWKFEQLESCMNFNEEEYALARNRIFNIISIFLDLTHRMGNISVYLCEVVQVTTVRRWSGTYVIGNNACTMHP